MTNPVLQYLYAFTTQSGKRSHSADKHAKLQCNNNDEHGEKNLIGGLADWTRHIPETVFHKIILSCWCSSMGIVPSLGKEASKVINMEEEEGSKGLTEKQECLNQIKSNGLHVQAKFGILLK